MKKLFFILALSLWTLTVSAQTEKQKAFVDSCTKAINYYQDFLVKLSNGKNSFQKGNRLFVNSYKQLVDLKAINEVNLEEEEYQTLIKAINILKDLKFDDFIATEHKSKSKVPIKINDKTTNLSKTNGAPIEVVLGILTARLEDFK